MACERAVAAQGREASSEVTNLARLGGPWLGAFGWPGQGQKLQHPFPAPVSGAAPAASGTEPGQDQ